MPEGSIDLGKNIPVIDLNLIAPSVELIARDNLHPALSDVLLDAAQEVHSSVGLFVKSGKFPNATTQEFQVSQTPFVITNRARAFYVKTLHFGWQALSVGY